MSSASYVTFAELTADTSAPTFNLEDSVTKSGNYIYRVGGQKISVADGGTGVGTLSNNGILLGAGSGNIMATAAPTNGQLLIGSSGNAPVLSTLVAGAGISISNAPGSITISSAGSSIVWTEVVGVSASLLVNRGYIANNASLVTLTLPVLSALGDKIIVLGKGAGKFTIAQNTSQFINVGGVSTSVGVGGSISSQEQFDSVELICTTANVGWNVSYMIGSFLTA